MSTIALPELHINYLLDEPQADEGLPVLVLSNSLGTTLAMWDPQVAALRKHFRLLRYDTRGHGESSCPSGPYSMPQLAQDVLGLMDRLGIEQAHFCGLSMGGMIGTWLGIHAGSRFSRLVLCNTNGFTEQPAFWDNRIDILREDGVGAIADGVMARFFSPEFASKQAPMVAEFKAQLMATPVDGYAACCAAIRDMDFRRDLAKINAPTLIIAGAKDEASPPDKGRYLAEHIPGAKLQVLPAAHLSNVEAPESFSQALIDFLQPS